MVCRVNVFVFTFTTVSTNDSYRFLQNPYDQLIFRLNSSLIMNNLQVIVIIFGEQKTSHDRNGGKKSKKKTPK